MLKTTTNNEEHLLQYNHNVVKHIWKVEGKTYTFNTARDDDRSKDEMIALQKYTGRLDGVWGMIAKHPDNWTIVKLHSGLHKTVAEAIRQLEILKDERLGYTRLLGARQLAKDTVAQ
jgi:hypothetical protein